MDWKTSSKSTCGAQCVEVSFLETEELKDGKPIVVYVRDSKNPEGDTLGFTAEEWDAFLDGVKEGEFDLPEDVVPVA